MLILTLKQAWLCRLQAHPFKNKNAGLISIRPVDLMTILNW